MLESIKDNTFEYEKLSQEEQQKRGILGRLKGIIADFKRPTRNGRIYGQELWERVFDDPLTQEKIENRCMFGELEHPADGREQIDPQKIAVCLAEKPKKDKDGHLIGVFDILSTPCGNILKTLLDYGTTVGVSSRGTGDTFVNADGQEEVDPSSYDCTGWDIVITPAVKEARMTPVTEGIGNKSLKVALAESLNKAKGEDRKVMIEALDDLGINMEGFEDTSEEEESSQEKEAQPEKVVNIETVEESAQADNDGEALVEQLSTALTDNQNLQKRISNLQEKLSVCYAKEYDYEDEIEKYKKTISRLTEQVKTIAPLKQRVTSLSESITKGQASVQDCEKKYKDSQREVERLSKLNNRLSENLQLSKETAQKLEEDSRKQSDKLTTKISTLQESVKGLNETIDNLKEQIADLTKQKQINQKQYSDKLDSQNKLVERYRKIAKTAVSKYMESQADKLGVSVNEIKSRLNESYSFDDIDRVCDDIQEYRIGIGTLPFNTSFKNTSKIRFQESKSTNSIKTPVNQDDVVDKSLLGLINEL